MKIFLDSACLETLKSLKSYGIIDGVTTNPSLLAPYKQNWRDHVKSLAMVVEGPTSVEVTELSLPDMIRQGEEIAALHSAMVVKLPCTEDGLRACRALRDKDIAVNMTLCFSLPQAWLAAKAGANFISPFMGRLDDTCASGIDLVGDMVEMYRRYGFSTQILAASIRTLSHVQDVLRLQADVITLPKEICLKLMYHPLTEAGLEKFMTAWSHP